MWFVMLVLLSLSWSTIAWAGASPICGLVSGTRFNLEPRTNARVQFAPSIDVLRNRVAPGVDLVIGVARDARNSLVPQVGPTGYYVDRAGTCEPDFEGSLDLQGFPQVVVDPVRDVVLAVGRTFDPEAPDLATVRLYRTTGARLLDPLACPSGTQSAAGSATCWPDVFDVAQVLPGGFLGRVTVAVDERTSGLGAGMVYIAYQRGALENTFAMDVVVLACQPDLSTCAETLVENPPFFLGQRLPHIAVRPDGEVSVIYLADPGGDSAAVILYSHCLPQPGTAPLICSAGREVAVYADFGARRLASQRFALDETPEHAHRQDSNGTETYVVFDSCSGAVVPIGGIFCTDTNVYLAASRDRGQTWTSRRCLSCGLRDEFAPSIHVDRPRNTLFISTYSANADSIYLHRLQVLLYQIVPGSGTPDSAVKVPLTTLLDDPSRDPTGLVEGLIRLGLTARQGHVYVHYISHNSQGIYTSRQLPEPNNHVVRFDY